MKPLFEIPKFVQFVLMLIIGFVLLMLQTFTSGCAPGIYNRKTGCIESEGDMTRKGYAIGVVVQNHGSYAPDVGSLVGSILDYLDTQNHQTCN